MNERIRELADQSGITQYVSSDNKYLEWFAELIVQQCATVCTDSGKRHDGLYSAWAEDCSKRIKNILGLNDGI